MGYGGQYIIIDESKALVIAVTSSARSSAQYRDQLLDVIFGKVMSSFSKASLAERPKTPGAPTQSSMRLDRLKSMLMFWMGVLFEIPIVLFFLARMGVGGASRLRRYRRYVVVGAFILGAVVTPTMDPINQSIVAGSVVLLYELGILLAWVGGKRE